MNIFYFQKKQELKIKFIFALVISLFLFQSAHATTLEACSKAKNICTQGVSSWISNCMGRTSIPYAGTTPAYCYAQASSYQNACNVAANQCTETYVYPQPKLISILYLPPGDRSSIGYSSSNSAGTSETYSITTASSNTIGVSGSLMGVSAGSSVTIGTTTSNSNTIATTLQSTSSTTWATLGNPIDHSTDMLTIWLNPQITEAKFNYAGGGPADLITQGPNPKSVFGVYTLLGNAAYNPIAGSNGEPVIGTQISNGNTALITLPISALLNPNTLLPSQLVSRTNSDGTIVAGLLSMCKNRITETQCTITAAQNNACGCTASDFSPIIQLHPFFNPVISNPSVASINAIDPNGARFVAVKDASGYDLAIPLQAGVTKNLTISDSYNNSYTYTYTKNVNNSAKVGFSYGGAGIDGSITWSFSQSVGKNTSTGIAHSQFLTLATSSSNCYQYVNVYEDTLFHTFLFTNASNAPNPCP